MRAVLLIGANFMVEHRWMQLILLLYVLLMSGTTVVGGAKREDIIVLTRMMAVYGVGFAAVMASATVHNDRRTRRILSVLSKGITRGQYLAGAILGILLGTAAYCALVGVGMGLAAAGTGVDAAVVWKFMAFTLCACVLAVVTPLFFGTFVHPMFAMGLAGLTLGLAAFAPAAIRLALPVDVLARTLAGYSFVGGGVPWDAALIALADSVVLWAAATAIFSRRDIAVAVE